jgi:predicted TIM-barrel fold metal-dependent hydrolase
LQLNPHQFRDAVRLVEKHPEIPVIIGHMGSPTLDDLTAKKDLLERVKSFFRTRKDLY